MITVGPCQLKRFYSILFCSVLFYKLHEYSHKASKEKSCEMSDSPDEAKNIFSD